MNKPANSFFVIVPLACGLITSIFTAQLLVGGRIIWGCLGALGAAYCF